MIPIGDLPFFLCMPTYPTHKAILPFIPSTHLPVEQEGFVFLSESPADMERKLAEYGADYVSTTVDHLSFARMLAKIALGYCVVEFGRDEYTPTVAPLILGHANGYPAVISSSSRPTSTSSDVPLEQRYEHQLLHLTSSEGLIYVRIDLFINLGAPVYYVLAGTLGKQILRFGAQ